MSKVSLIPSGPGFLLIGWSKLDSLSGSTMDFIALLFPQSSGNRSAAHATWHMESLSVYFRGAFQEVWVSEVFGVTMVKQGGVGI